jgi:hypothetical protein
VKRDEAIQVVRIGQPEVVIRQSVADVGGRRRSCRERGEKTAEVDISPMLHDLAALNPVDGRAREKCRISARGNARKFTGLRATELVAGRNLVAVGDLIEHGESKIFEGGKQGGIPGEPSRAVECPGIPDVVTRS